MPDVPPKQPVTGVDSVKIDPPAGLPPAGESAMPSAEPFHAQVNPLPSAGIVAIHGTTSPVSPEAFPVLKAFQEYLESERQRASRRVIVLSAIFAAVIVFVLGAFVMIYLKAQDRQDSLLQAVIAQSLRQRDEAPAQIVVSQPAQPAQPSVQEISALISDAIAKDRQSQSAVLEKTLAAYSSAIESAKAESEALKAELAKAKEAAAKPAPAAQAAPKTAKPAPKAAAPAAQNKTQPSAQAKPAPKVAAQTAQNKTQTAASAAAAQAKTAAPAPTPAAPAPAALEIPKYPAPPPPAGFSSGSMPIKAGKEAKPVSWRIYLPER